MAIWNRPTLNTAHCILAWLNQFFFSYCFKLELQQLVDYQLFHQQKKKIICNNFDNSSVSVILQAESAKHVLVPASQQNSVGMFYVIIVCKQNVFYFIC